MVGSGCSIFWSRELGEWRHDSWLADRGCCSPGGGGPWEVTFSLAGANTQFAVGDTVAVVGCGGVGLNVVQCARIAGGHVIAILWCW